MTTAEPSRGRQVQGDTDDLHARDPLPGRLPPPERHAHRAARDPQEHIEAWLGDLRDHGKAKATISAYYRSSQPVFRWAIEEGFLTESPLRYIARPKVPDQPVPILTDDQIRALLKTADGPVYEGMPDSEFVDPRNLRAACKAHNVARGFAATLERPAPRTTGMLTGYYGKRR
jgi:integrase